MALNYIDNLIVKAVKTIRAVDTTITIAAMDVAKLNAIGIGNHIYFTLAHNGITEVVKYTHTGNLSASNGNQPIAVDRDVNGTGLKNFAAPICLKVEWTKLQLQEFICQSFPLCGYDVVSLLPPNPPSPI